MEKDIDKIPKNPDTDIIIRVDDFGGKVGLTIREFVKSDRYTGFTKAGTRIPAEHFKTFKAAINSIDESDFIVSNQESQKQEEPQKQEKLQTEKQKPPKKMVKQEDELEM
jgi:hypothetical protein